MTTIFTKKALTSIKYSGDVTVKGQLGKLAIVTPGASQKTVSITEYYSVYEIQFTVFDPTYEIILPAIDSDVLIGWKARFVVTTPYTIITSVNQKINLISSTGNIVYSVGTTDSSVNAISITTSFAVTAIGPTTNDWLVEIDTYTSTNIANSVVSYSSNAVAKSFPILGRLKLQTDGSTNINVLFSNPVTVNFIMIVSNFSFPYSIDYRFYNFNAPSSIISILASGSYYLEYNIIVTTAGGATTTNCQFAVRLNGITTLPGFSITQTGFNSMLYTLKAFMTLSAGDYIEIIAGRSATSAGTLTINPSSVLNIICFGA